MDRREGVIKFNLEFKEAACLEPAMIEEINCWRAVLHRLHLIGQSPDRYGGLGFGNISCRCPAIGYNNFIISGTQTGLLPVLTTDHYAVVTRCEPGSNYVHAKGNIKPSSEALTHGQVYHLDTSAFCVVHVHCPEIWRQRKRLQIPATPAEIDYGSPAMAGAVARLFDEGAVATLRCFVMGGHEDGVVSFGADAEHAVTPLLVLLGRALLGTT